MERNKSGFRIEIRVNGIPRPELTMKFVHRRKGETFITVNFSTIYQFDKDDVISVYLISENSKSYKIGTGQASLVLKKERMF